MKKLPFGGEFSPNQVDLHWLLATASETEGSREELAERIRDKYYGDSCAAYEGPERVRQQLKRAGNVIIGMVSYDLLEPDTWKLTTLARALLATDDEETRYRMFAQHILVYRSGSDVLQAVDTLNARGETTKASLARELESLGYQMPRATTKHLILLGWLRMANVLDKNSYAVNRKVLGSLLDAPASILSDLDSLSQMERYFLRSLGRLQSEPGQMLDVAAVVRNAENLFPVKFPQDRVQETILRPLAERRWIELVRGSKGRGAKSGSVQGTDRFQSQFVQQLLEEDAPILSPDIRAGLRLSIGELLQDVRAEGAFTKGVGLELLALRIAHMLDLQPRKWRLRSQNAEVDLIVETARLQFSRWQIQCKNTAKVRVEDLAKEIGLAFLMKSHVVVMVTTGEFAKSVVRQARRIDQETYLQVILIGGELLERIAEERAYGALLLVEYLRSQAGEALKQKAPQLEDIDD